MIEVKYKINQFAAIIGTTPKALRLYEEMGLLKPGSIDKKTKYRYYTPEQIRDAALIIQLKTIGFSLGDIKEYLQNKITLEDKKRRLIERKQTIDLMLIGLDYINQTQSGYSAYIKSEPQICVIQKQVKAAHFRDLIPAFQKFSEHEVTPHYRITLPEYYVAEFLDGDYRETDLSAAFRIGVTPKPGDNCDVLPPQDYITTIHKGNYDTIWQAYEFLENYMQVYNIAPVGNPSERYLENYGSQDIEDNYLTEVRYPICPDI
jgi:DNA-binding transcriptional MerR regulator